MNDTYKMWRLLLDKGFMFFRATPVVSTIPKSVGWVSQVGAVSSMGGEAELGGVPDANSKSPFCRDSPSWLLPPTCRRRGFCLILYMDC